MRFFKIAIFSQFEKVKLNSPLVMPREDNQ